MVRKTLSTKERTKDKLEKPSQKNDASVSAPKSVKHKRVPQKLAYMRKQSKNHKSKLVSGPTRMRNFLHSCLTSLRDNKDSFYKENTPKHQQLFLSSDETINKASSAAIDELCRAADQLGRSYVSRACMLAHSNKSHSVSVVNLRTVTNFFAC